MNDLSIEDSRRLNKKATRQRYRVRRKARRQAQEVSSDEQPQDRAFNPWRVPEANAEKVWHLVRSIMDETKIETLDKYGYKRRHPMYAEDRQKLIELVTALVCNLVHAHVSGLTGGTFVPRDKTRNDTRYTPDFLSTVLPLVLDKMAEAGWVTQIIGKLAKVDQFTKRVLVPAMQTHILPSERLTKRIADDKITLADLTYKYERPRKGGLLTEAQEIVLLKDEKPLDEKQPDGDSVKELQEYEDTETTHLYRYKLRMVNDALRSANISMMPGYSGPVIDFKDRQLRRYFQKDFTSCGRMYGGFWQPLGKETRRKAILLSGRLTTELDFSQMGPRILYGMCKLPVPAGDLYEIPGYERSRAAIKVVFSAMMFCTEPLKKLPKLEADQQFHPDEVRPVADVIKAIELRHPTLARSFFTGIGFKVQFIESSITLEIMLNLIRLGVLALPIHDSFVVAEQDAPLAEEVMLRHHRDIAGVEGKVHKV